MLDCVYERKWCYQSCIFPLTDKGYKIPTHFAVSRVSYVLNQNGAFTIYRLKDTDDYYSFCSINQSGDCDIQAYNVYGDALDVDVYRVEVGFIIFTCMIFPAVVILKRMENECCFLMADIKIAFC